VQIHHYLVVSGAQLADVAVLIAGQDFRLYEVRADADIGRELVAAEHSFWHHHVEERVPPEPSNTQDAIRRWGGLAAAGRVVACEAELLAAERMLQIRTQRQQLDSDDEEARVKLMQALGEHGDHLVDEAGVLLVSWKLDRGRKAYTVEAREPARRFLLKG
jgi:predicted phage-related endonuclease